MRNRLLPLIYESEGEANMERSLCGDSLIFYFMALQIMAQRITDLEAQVIGLANDRAALLQVIEQEIDM